MTKDPLRESLREFLQSTGRLELQRLGGATKPRREVSKKELDHLREQFPEAQRFQNKMILLCTGLLCAIFVFLTGMMVYGLVTRRPLVGVAGGVVLVLMPVVERLRRLGIDRFVTAILVVAIEDLSPEEGTRLIEAVYWGLALPEQAGFWRFGARRPSRRAKTLAP